MKKIEEQKHFLALMARPGDYVFIDISKLDLANGYNPVDLAGIDSFTMCFSTTELMAAIKRANMASEKYLNGQLVIQDNQKHNPIRIIDKDFYNVFLIEDYLKEKLKDKQELNKIINKFRSLVKNEELLEAFKSNNLEIALNELFSLPYLIQRKFIIYLIEMRNTELKQKKEQERIRDKAA